MLKDTPMKKIKQLLKILSFKSHVMVLWYGWITLIGARPFFCGLHLKGLMSPCYFKKSTCKLK